MAHGGGGTGVVGVFGTDPPNLFAQRLRERRCQLHLSRVRASVRCGISEWSMAEYETGGAYPRLPNLIKLSDGLEVSMEYWR